MPRHDGPTQGVSMVSPNHDPIKRQEPGRVCAVDECETVLSIYNKKVVCSVHEDFDRVHPSTWFGGQRGVR